MPSPWQQHVAKWSNCTRCHLQHCRSNVVLARGVLPADVLFVGEAPGESEDALGVPLIGPAGKLFDNDCSPLGMIQRAFPSHVELDEQSRERTVLDVRCCFSNVISCIPRDEDWQKVGKPEATELQACLPRLKELVAMAKPKLVILLGVEAAKWVGLQRGTLGLGNVKVIEVVHPAYIIRANVVQQPLEIKRCVLAMAAAYQEVFGDA